MSSELHFSRAKVPPDENGSANKKPSGDSLKRGELARHKNYTRGMFRSVTWKNPLNESQY